MSVKRWDSDREGEMCDAAITGGPGEYVLYIDYASLESALQQCAEALQDVMRRNSNFRKRGDAAIAAAEKVARVREGK